MSKLKQGTLSFSSAKRTNSASIGKLQQKITEKVKNKRVVVPTETEDDANVSKALGEISSDEESPATTRIIVPTKRTRAGTKPRPSTTKQVLVQQSEKQNASPAVAEREHLDVEDKAGRYRKYHNEVRSKMGYIPPVHAEGQNKIHQILRFFDMSYEFGPCIGMTRLERWERAEAFGLNPPVEVRDILLTKEGTEESEYARCVLDNEV